MGTLVLGADVANEMLDALDAAINTGTGTAIMRIYTGVPGSDHTLVPAGTALQDINLANPAWGAAAVTGTPGSASSKITLQTDTPQAITASGTAGSVAFLDRNGALVFKGDAGATGSGALVELSSTTIAGSGASINESASVITFALNLTI